MPLYPFLILAGLLVTIIVVPPLLAAFIDYHAERRRRPTSGLPRTDGGGQPRE